MPGASLHAFLFFVPTIIAGNGLRRRLMLATLLIGPVASMLLAKGDLTTYPLEWWVALAWRARACVLCVSVCVCVCVRGV